MRALRVHGHVDADTALLSYVYIYLYMSDAERGTCVMPARKWAFDRAVTRAVLFIVSRS